MGASEADRAHSKSLRCLAKPILNNFGAAGGFEVVADAAPLDASAEDGGGEIYNVEEGD